MVYRIPGKSVSQYTEADWGAWVDSTWGPGQTAAEQLNIFDAFYDSVDTRWAGFPNLGLNWDSLRSVYRPQIGSGLSRGRFYSLMSRMWLALTEIHSGIFDLNVDTVFGTTAFRYRRGIPLLLTGNTDTLSVFGAAVTPLPDSSNLVYRAIPGNPLGFVPGDVVLGYNGIAWKTMYRSLLDAGVPVDLYYSWTGSSPESKIYDILSGVTRNWGMFDTVDVVKYATGDTVHLPTAPLETFTQKLWATDQVPVPGVPLPNPGPNAGSVTYGIVQGTNIGYIYQWDWGNIHSEGSFRDAITALCRTSKVEGLIIDFRRNTGGNPAYANKGLAQLFSFDPSPNLIQARRTSTSDHMGFSLEEFSASHFGQPWEFTPSATPYDRPIAVLIGPGCLSAGDHNAQRLRYHPMSRFFGKPTDGAFAAGEWCSASLPGGWGFSMPASIMYSKIPGEGYLIHKGVQPDEAVWLTRNGVATGEDDVVKRAIAWITTLAYAHDAAVNKYVVRKTGDTVIVTTKIYNPLGHSLDVSAILERSDRITVDSVLFMNDGLHGDGAAGDSIWGASLRTPSGEGSFGIAVRTDDRTAGTFRRYPNVRTVTSAGPIIAGYEFSTADSLAAPGKTLNYWIRLTNAGTTEALPLITAKLRCLDATVIVQNVDLVYGTIAAGQSALSSVFVRVRYPSRPGNYPVDFAVDIYSNSVLLWTSTFTDLVTGISDEPGSMPTAYALEQNYPNPFNPVTTIRFDLPRSSEVRLNVYDVLGREVALLVNGKKEAGHHEVTFDAAGVSSGVYLYRLTADGFVQTRKLLVLR